MKAETSQAVGSPSTATRLTPQPENVLLACASVLSSEEKAGARHTRIGVGRPEDRVESVAPVGGRDAGLG